MPQAVEHLVLEEDGHQQKYRRPTSFVEEVALFLEEAYTFLLELRNLFKGRWFWVILGTPVAILAAGAFAALWEFIPFFNSGL